MLLVYLCEQSSLSVRIHWILLLDLQLQSSVVPIHSALAVNLTYQSRMNEG